MSMVLLVFESPRTIPALRKWEQIAGVIDFTGGLIGIPRNENSDCSVVAVAAQEGGNRRMYQVKVLHFVSVVCYHFLHAATAAVVTLA